MTLFTVGYEGRSVAELVELLRTAGVARVVDVRELPLSRRPGFSKTPLAAALAEAGIRYEHVRALGNPKQIRDRYKRGDLEAGSRAYRAQLEEHGHAALVELADSLADDTAACLLCFEREQSACHRDVIAAALVERLPGLVVVPL